MLSAGTAPSLPLIQPRSIAESQTLSGSTPWAEINPSATRGLAFCLAWFIEAVLDPIFLVDEA
jgi:hypothetical protein